MGKARDAAKPPTVHRSPLPRTARPTAQLSPGQFCFLWFLGLGPCVWPRIRNGSKMEPTGGTGQGREPGPGAGRNSGIRSLHRSWMPTCPRDARQVGGPCHVTVKAAPGPARTWPPDFCFPICEGDPCGPFSQVSRTLRPAEEGWPLLPSWKVWGRRCCPAATPRPPDPPQECLLLPPPGPELQGRPR